MFQYIFQTVTIAANVKCRSHNPTFKTKNKNTTDKQWFLISVLLKNLKTKTWQNDYFRRKTLKDIFHNAISNYLV